MVTIYTKPNCVDCQRTKLAFAEAGIEYEEIDLFTNRDALAKIKELGFRNAPVIITDTDSWSGYRPDKIFTNCNDNSEVWDF